MVKRILFLFVIVLISCDTTEIYNKGTFGYDLNFLSDFIKPIILSNEHSQIVLSAEFQGRVMTSTSNGLSGKSYGWINYDFIKKDTILNGGNPYGGEDRFWLGPIGSKFSLFYNGKPIKDENWFIPNAIDSEKFNVKSQSKNAVTFQKELRLKNNIGTFFEVELIREIQLFTILEIEKELHVKISKEIKSVGFTSKNTIKNLGEDWVEEKGIIAPWILGMYQGNSKSIGVFPYKSSDENPLGISEYLSKCGSERLKITDKVLLYKTDGKFRNKIGLTSKNALPIIGNYDGENGVLTIVTFSYNPSSQFLSTTEIENDVVFGGDVVNSYNNAAEKGKPSFFELESAASALILKKGESNIHINNTFHFEGDFNELDHLSKAVLGINLTAISL